MTLRGNHLYDHLGVRSNRLDSESAETRMPINNDVRVPGGLRAAPLGLAFEQGVALYLFDKVLAVPSQLSLRIRDNGIGISGVVSVTRVVRLGRSLVTIEGHIVDDSDPERLLAFGTMTWSVIGQAPGVPPLDAHPAEPLPAAGVNIIDAAAIRSLPDGSGCRLDGITAQTSGPGGILHAGMFELLLEEAALVGAQTATGAREARVVDVSYSFMQPGKVGPFVASPDVLFIGDEGVDAKVIVRDEGNDGRVPATAYVRVRCS